MRRRAHMADTGELAQGLAASGGEGDAIERPRRSAQLRFSDETLVALRAKSRFHVADYRFGGADDGASTAVFALLQGGLRTITGLIGRGRPERYRMTTPLALPRPDNAHLARMLSVAMTEHVPEEYGDIVAAGMLNPSPSATCAAIVCSDAMWPL